MLRSAFNPFASPDVALSYEAWYETTGRRADRLEKALLKWLLASFPQASSLLEVGCGTGHFTRWFKDLGLQTAGLDLSLPILVEAIRLGSVRCIHNRSVCIPCDRKPSRRPLTRHLPCFGRTVYTWNRGP